MGNQPKTTAQEAWRDLGFLFARSIGVIWVVNHAPFLRLKQWAQDREDGLIPLPGSDRLPPDSDD